MKRDWKRIRRVLLAVREHGIMDAETPELDYHLDLCRQARFIEARDLTWAGHDAAVLLEDEAMLDAVLAEHGSLPWEVLARLLLQRRWPEDAAEIADARTRKTRFTLS